MQHFDSTKDIGYRSKHYCVKHKMPKVWTKVMGPKTWPTVSETVSQKGVAAWQWLQVGYRRARTLANAQGREVPGLDAALFSQLVRPQFILESVDSHVLGASLGHASWAVLLYPLHVVRVGENGWRALGFRSTPAATVFDHVTDPRLWQVIPYRSEMDERCGVILEQVANPEPLLQASLRQCQHLNHDLLVSIAALLDLGLGADASRRTLLQMLATNVSGGDESFVAAVLDQDQKVPPVAVATLLGDPVFEAAFQDMPDDDKQEFPEVRKEQARSRVRQHVADRATQAARARRAAPLPRRRVRRKVMPAAGHPAPAALGPAPAGGDPAPDPAPAALVPAPEGGAPAPAAPAGGAPAPAVVPIPAGEGPAAAAPPPPPPLPLPGRVPRGELWDRQQRFGIARTHRYSEFQSVTVTCLLHRADGERCNKSFTPGTEWSEAEATARIKEWCARGLDIPDVAGGKKRHMDINPRRFRPEEVRGEAELAAVVGGLL